MSDPRHWRRVPGEGAYARPERERRFLVRRVPISAEPVRLIEDRYLIGTTLRLRHVSVAGESVFKLTQKVRSVDADDPSDVSITNLYLSAEEHALLCAVPAAVLTKMRSLHRTGAYTFVLDEFSGRLQGLRLAEVEVGELDERVVLPDWLGREVTRDERFSGGRLAVAGDAEISELLGQASRQAAGSAQR